MDTELAVWLNGHQLGRPFLFPFPRKSEPDKLVKILTDRASRSEISRGKMIRRAILRGVDACFHKVRSNAQAGPTTACLAGWGFETALTQRPAPRYMTTVDWLAKLGRIDAAWALERYLQRRNGKWWRAAARADRRVARYRLVAALRSDDTCVAAIEATPGATPARWFSPEKTCRGASPISCRATGAPGDLIRAALERHNSGLK